MLMCMLQWAAYRLFDLRTGSMERAAGERTEKRNHDEGGAMK